MEYLALYACEFVCPAVPAFIMYLALRKLKRNRQNDSLPPVSLAAVFAVYLFALLHITEAGALHDALRFGLDLNPHQMNLIPFANFSEGIGEHLLNVLLFVPLGLLIPMFLGNCSRVLPIAVMSFVTSASVEVSQLLNSRVTDIDDLLMNVAGSLIGYGVFRLIEQRKNMRLVEIPSMSIAATMIAAAFLGRFLIYDEMGLAKLLFGF